MISSIWKLPPDPNPRGSKWPTNFWNLENTAVYDSIFEMSMDNHVHMLN